MKLAKGGYGEYVLATEHSAAHLPDTIDFTTGAVLSCAVGTGFHARGRVRLGPGDPVLVTNADEVVVSLDMRFHAAVKAITGDEASPPSSRSPAPRPFRPAFARYGPVAG